jgi:hypothetical protein
LAKPSTLTELSIAIRALARFRPYSTSREAPVFDAAIERLQNVEALLLTIHEVRPQALQALEASAFEELQMQYEDPIPAVAALVSRYCRKREPMR